MNSHVIRLCLETLIVYSLNNEIIGTILHIVPIETIRCCGSFVLLHTINDKFHLSNTIAITGRSCNIHLAA
ncbi:hypothetical protein D3C76_1070170 [compost metagenome]